MQYKIELTDDECFALGVFANVCALKLVHRAKTVSRQQMLKNAKLVCVLAKIQLMLRPADKIARKVYIANKNLLLAERN